MMCVLCAVDGVGCALTYPQRSITDSESDSVFHVSEEGVSCNYCKTRALEPRPYI